MDCPHCKKNCNKQTPEKDTGYLKDVIEGYKEITGILEGVLNGDITPEYALKNNPFLREEINVALSEANYI